MPNLAMPATAAALAIFDATQLERDALWADPACAAAVMSAEAADDAALRLVQDAFHSDTETINSLESCRRMRIKDLRAMALLRRDPSTVYIVPTETDIGGQCRIVARSGHIPNARDDYRANPALWREIGLMDHRGDVRCLAAPPNVRDDILSCQPLSAGVQFHV